MDHTCLGSAKAKRAPAYSVAWLNTDAADADNRNHNLLNVESKESQLCNWEISIAL